MASYEKRLQSAQAKLRIAEAQMATSRAMAVKAQYEAIDPVKQWKRGNSRTGPSVLPNEKQNLRSGNRFSAIEKCRDSLRNSFLTQAIVSNMAMHIVGTGPKARLHLENETQGIEVQAFLNDVWAHECEVSGRLDLASSCDLIVQELLLAGDILAHWDGAEDKFRFVEAERLRENSRKIEGAEQTDGVYYDALGRYVYFAFSRNLETLVQAKDALFLPAEDCAFMVAPGGRYTDYRGVPKLLPLLAKIQDIEDMLSLEIQSAKVNASMAVALMKQPQTIDFGAGIGSVPMVPGSEQNGTYSELTRMFGGQVVDLAPDERLEMLTNNRPSTALEPFVNFISLGIGSAVSLPLSYLLLSTKASYSASRHEANQAEITFRKWQKLLERKFLDWAAIRAVEANRFRLPVRWWQGLSWQHQETPPIDEGREAKAQETQLATGVKTLSDFTQDWKAKIEQRGREKYAMEEAGLLPVGTTESTMPIEEEISARILIKAFAMIAQMGQAAQEKGDTP